jgi:hypothetical protein
LECSRGCGRIIGKFPERTLDACVYRVELLGLLATHLFSWRLTSYHQLFQVQLRYTLSAFGHGALESVENLPPHRIPSSVDTWTYSRILWYIAGPWPSLRNSYMSLHINSII